jgi:hypothetical protein
MKKKDNYKSSPAKDPAGGSSKTSPTEAVKDRPIKAKIKKLEAKMKEERDNGTFRPDNQNATANKLRDRAIAVILRDPGTKEWDDFMELFGFTDEELDGLVPSRRRRTGKDEAIAYLIGGGVCGGSSLDMDGPGIFSRVGDEIDD